MSRLESHGSSQGDRSVISGKSSVPQRQLETSHVPLDKRVHESVCACVCLCVCVCVCVCWHNEGYLKAKKKAKRSHPCVGRFKVIKSGEKPQISLFEICFDNWNSLHKALSLSAAPLFKQRPIMNDTSGERWTELVFVSVARVSAGKEIWFGMRTEVLFPFTFL